MEIKVKYMHTILHGHRETLSSLETRARTANLRLVPIHTRVLTYEHSYGPSTISLWNKLPVHIVNETYFDKFSSNVTFRGKTVIPTMSDKFYRSSFKNYGFTV